MGGPAMLRSFVCGYTAAPTPPPLVDAGTVGMRNGRAAWYGQPHFAI